MRVTAIRVTVMVMVIITAAVITVILRDPIRQVAGIDRGAQVVGIVLVLIRVALGQLPGVRYAHHLWEVEQVVDHLEVEVEADEVVDA